MMSLLTLRSIVSCAVIIWFAIAISTTTTTTSTANALFVVIPWTGTKCNAFTRPTAITATTTTAAEAAGGPSRVLLCASPDANNEDENGEEDEEDDDDDDDSIQPYGSRSLAWTKRYRKLNSYEQCRQRVLRFGHRSKADWDEAVASGQLGAYVPSRPDEMYASEWISWDEWLGLMRSYDETRHLAVSILGLKSLDEYIIFVRQNPKRAEGLRIPVRPDLKYKKEWISEEDFFSTSSTTTKRMNSNDDNDNP